MYKCHLHEYECVSMSMSVYVLKSYMSVNMGVC